MRRIFREIVAVLTFCLLISSQTAAQERSGTTTGDLRISTADLALTLRPLTKPELQIEAEAWMKTLQRAVADLSRAQLAAGKLEGEERSRRLAEVERKREERNQIIIRVLAVLTELERKGGQADEFRTYIRAVQEPENELVDR